MSDRAQFVTALLNPGAPLPDGLIDGAGNSANRRFDVLRNNVATSLGEALRTGFPVVTRLLGDENMKAIAAMYWRAHPPQSPVLTDFGEALPIFLEQLPQLAHLGYLPDIARLELALRHAYHAADAVPVDPARLAEIEVTNLPETSLTLAPALRVIRSSWPIHAIWTYNTQENAPKPPPEPQDVLITRPGFDPAPHLLPPGGADWIAALMLGQNIGDALTSAQRVTPAFDLTTSLALLLQERAIIALSRKDSSA